MISDHSNPPLVYAAPIPSRRIWLEDGHDIRTVQETLGYRGIAPTMLDTHVLNRGPAGVRSPADRMLGETGTHGPSTPRPPRRATPRAGARRSLARRGPRGGAGRPPLL